jgi:hypothetical protein
MIGPLPTAPSGFNRVLVAIDKFTKWIEVKPVTCPKADRVLDFLDELVHRYGLPHRIITDLGSNFNNHQSWEYCESSEIDVRYVSVCRMDLPGPTTSVGTRTDYSVAPWDYPACATRHLMAWSTRTTKE